MNRWVVLLAVLAAALLTAPLRVEAASAEAMVTSLTGTSKAVTTGEPGRPARLLERLPVGSTLAVPAGGVCVLTFFHDGHREEVRGPAKVRIRKGGLTLLSGDPGAIRVKPVERTFVRRGEAVGMEHLGGDLARIQKMDLANCSPQYTILSSEPVFRWRSRLSAPSFTILLLDEEGREVARRTAPAGSLAWHPEEEALAPGRTWFWFPYAGEPPAEVQASDLFSFRVMDPQAAREFEEQRTRAWTLLKENPEDVTPLLLLWDRCLELNLLEEAWKLVPELTRRLPDQPELLEQTEDLRKMLGIPGETWTRPWDP